MTSGSQPLIPIQGMLLGALVVALSALLVWSGAAKLVAIHQQNTGRLLALIPLPSRIRHMGLKTVVVSEFVIALLLLARPLWGLAGALVLFLAFTWRLLWIRAERCDCFGGMLEFGASSTALLVRNAVLMLIAAGGLWLARSLEATMSIPSVLLGSLLVLTAVAIDAYVDAHPHRPIHQGGGS